jgi:hypothetical protein
LRERTPMAPPDQALRRLVADLAQTEPGDVEAILGGLESPQAARVRRLLADYVGQDAGPRAARPAPDPQPAPAVVNVIGLSPWLAARLGHEPRLALDPAVRGTGPVAVPEPVAVFNMTSAALDSLRDAALAVQPRAAAPVETPHENAWIASWRRRLTAWRGRA